MTNNITVVIVNFNTPVYLQETVESFKSHYPETPVLIIDNGSEKQSADVIDFLTARFNHISSLLLDENINHGPAMHRAVEETKAPYIFYLDSDTRTDHGGFLELMAEKLEKDKKNYGIGKIRKINKRGFKDSNGFPVPLTPFMMIKKEHYESLPQFIHHGIPVIWNFKEAQRRGLKLINFPIEEYIYHKGRGTAESFGYNLGWRGKMDYILNKLGL